MKLLDRYEFTNGKRFETYYIESHETEHYGLPACDVIGFVYNDNNSGNRFIVMRPDEALIQARMLIDAVHKATSGYEIELQPSDPKVVQNVQM